MSEFDIDVESMLADILGGKDPVLDAVDETPEPETPTPVQEPEPEPDTRDMEQFAKDEAEAEDDSHACEDDEPRIPTLDEILNGPAPEPEPEVLSPAPEQEPEDSHACESDEDVAAAELPEIDESEWSKAVKVDTIQMPEFTSDELMEDLDIRNYGTLVSLTTLRWHAKVRDRSAALNAAHATGADEAAYEARKRLLVGADEKLKRVHTAIDAARTEHYRMTLPWSTVGVNDHGKRAGPRLLPNTLFFDYTQKMAKFKNDMDVALDEFVKAYPTLIALAQQKLGSAFDFSEYPPPSAIRDYFGLSFDFLPIPTGDDFGNVTLQQAEKLAMNVNRKTRQMLENAMQDAWKRLQDDMQHAWAALKNPNAKFHYTLIEKMKEHASMLSHLNVTKDPRIEAIRNKIDVKLARQDIKAVRKDDALRAALAKEAKAVLDMMQEYANVSTS